MEDDRKLLSLPPYLCLAFIHGEDDELSFCPVEENGGRVIEKNTPDLLHNENYTIRNCCHGWLILFDAKEIHYSLWNPAETIHLPALPLNPEQEIGYCILSSPPGNSDSMVVLFETSGPLPFYYCKIGYQQWTRTKQLVSPELNPVTLDGRVLFCNTKGEVWVVGTIDINPDRLAFSFLDLQDPRLNVPWECIKYHLVESCGKIFSFRSLHNADYGWEEDEVIAVQVFKMDVSQKEWERVQSFKDSAFFLGSHPFSCLATHLHSVSKN